MVGKSSRSKPVLTSSGLVISTSIPRSNWSRIQSSRLAVSTDALNTATFRPACSSNRLRREVVSRVPLYTV